MLDQISIRFGTRDRILSISHQSSGIEVIHISTECY